MLQYYLIARREEKRNQFSFRQPGDNISIFSTSHSLPGICGGACRESRCFMMLDGCDSIAIKMKTCAAICQNKMFFCFVLLPDYNMSC